MNKKSTRGRKSDKKSLSSRVGKEVDALSPASEKVGSDSKPENVPSASETVEGEFVVLEGAKVAMALNATELQVFRHEVPRKEKEALDKERLQEFLTTLKSQHIPGEIAKRQAEQQRFLLHAAKNKAA